MMDTAQPLGDFTIPRTMTPRELGDTLAHLVWENFTDFIAEGDAELPLGALGVPTRDGVPLAHAAEEALIFLMWAHTRGTQLAFVGRAPEPLLREGLDSMHRAVFEDMEGNGTPAAQLPVFEQRVAARYHEYRQAAQEGDDALGHAVVRHLCNDAEVRAEVREDVGQAVKLRAMAVTRPLRDFLDEVELVTGPPT